MLDRKLGIVTCDGENCSEQEEFDHDDFKGSIAFIKRLEWKIVDTIDGWRHFCSRCKK